MEGGSGETKLGDAILRVKPWGCEPCVLAAFFESGKLSVVLIYKGFTVGWDGPAESGLGGFPPSEDDTHREREKMKGHTPELGRGPWHI